MSRHIRSLRLTVCPPRGLALLQKRALRGGRGSGFEELP